MLDDSRDDDAAFLRGVHEAPPDTRYAQLAAFQLELTDPLFAAKLVEAPRAGRHHARPEGRRLRPGGAQPCRSSANLEPRIMDVIEASPMSALFERDNICFDANITGTWYVNVGA